MTWQKQTDSTLVHVSDTPNRAKERKRQYKEIVSLLDSKIWNNVGNAAIKSWGNLALSRINKMDFDCND